MKTAAIIAEYNPFHKGHAYQIEKVKELTGADHILIIMSGDFVQRGCPAIVDKYSRAEMALSCGADVVVELPVFYACGSAEIFAFGAVSILHALGCVDFLCFGCENADRSEDLQRLASLLNHETESYKFTLQSELKKGLSFPKARMKAAASVLDIENCEMLLSSPNHILALEYLRALERLHSAIIPVFIQRVGAGYHDTDARQDFASATAIRSSLSENGDITTLSALVPGPVYQILNRQYRQTFPIEADDLSAVLHYLLLRNTAEDLENYQDITADLANKIIRNRSSFRSFSQYCMHLKSKDVTYSRISRCLMHIILDIRKECADTAKQFPEPEYVRLLGFRKSSSPLLSEIKKSSRIPLITRPTADYNLNETARKSFAQDTLAANIYTSLCTAKFQTEFRHEYEQQIVRFTD